MIVCQTEDKLKYGEGSDWRGMVWNLLTCAWCTQGTGLKLNLWFVWLGQRANNGSEDRGFVLKCPVDVGLNLEAQCCEWWLVGPGVFTKHQRWRWPSIYPWPQLFACWGNRSCSPAGPQGAIVFQQCCCHTGVCLNSHFLFMRTDHLAQTLFLFMCCNHLALTDFSQLLPTAGFCITVTGTILLVLLQVYRTEESKAVM